MTERTRLAVVLAVALNAAALGALMAMFQVRVERAAEGADEPRIVAVAPFVPAPPVVEHVAPTEAIAAEPQFAARANTHAGGRTGDPALAVWKYLCNRDAAIGDAVQRACPAFSLGQGNLSVAGPLRRDTSDAVYGRQLATTEEPVGPARERLGPYPWDETLTSSNAPMEGQLQ